jgi:hypothetical protein
MPANDVGSANSKTGRYQPLPPRWASKWWPNRAYRLVWRATVDRCSKTSICGHLRNRTKTPGSHLPGEIGGDELSEVD